MIEEIRDGLTHTTIATTIRYIRRRGAKGDALADKRSAREPQKTTAEQGKNCLSESQTGK
jgi:transposase